MLVRELMTSPVVTVDQEAKVAAAMRLLSEHRLTALPVIDAAGLLVGVVSEADLLRARVQPDPRVQLRPVADAQPAREEDGLTARMSQPIVASPTTDVHDVVETMLATGIKSLPVVEAGRLVGMISRSDVVHLMGRTDEQICADARALLASADLDHDVHVAEGVAEIALAESAADAPAVRALASSVAGVVAVRFTL